MNIPSWWGVALLSLAAWRTFKLLAEDDILDKPRRYVTRMGAKWEKEGDPLPTGYRYKLAAFLTCPYCLGAWLSLAWWGAWQAWTHGTLVVAGVVAISALIPLLDNFAN